MIKKAIKNRDKLINELYGLSYDLKARQSCGQYWLKQNKKIIANVSIAGSLISFTFRN